MKKEKLLSLLLGGAVMANVFSMLFGCGGTGAGKIPADDLTETVSVSESGEIDEAQLPQEYIVKVRSNKDYTLIRGDRRIRFRVELTAAERGHNTRIIWESIDYEMNTLRATNRVPYLIHCGGKDYLYLYEYNEAAPQYSSIKFLELNDEGIAYSDNTQISFYCEPSDPRNMKMCSAVSVLGKVYAVVSCYVGEHGRPEVSDSTFYYCAEEFTKQVFEITEPCRVTVYPDADSSEGTEEVLPEGTQFTRLRTDGDRRTDLLLTDGRVFSVSEVYLFGEPEAVMSLTDLDGNIFIYTEV